MLSQTGKAARRWPDVPPYPWNPCLVARLEASGGPAGRQGPLVVYPGDDDRGRLELMHAGDFNRYSTQATLLPGPGLGILVPCNGEASAVRGAIPRAFLEMVTKGEPSLGRSMPERMGLSGLVASMSTGD